MTAFIDRLERFTVALSTALSMHLHRFWRSWAIIITALAIILGGGYWTVFAPPSRFSPNTVVVIAPGASLHSDALQLAAARVVAHPLAFELLVRLLGEGRAVQEGAYSFPSPENAFRVAERIVKGDFGVPAKQITFYEGMSVREMAQRIEQVVPQVSASDFIAVAQPYEGYLFPDTYTFAPSATARTIVDTMRENFQRKTVALQQTLASSTHSFADVVTMASLVQNEARTSESQRMVAGILWNRVAKGMPLQVDAVFGYIYSKQTYSPSLADLKVNSPYNTYTHVGLPPGPIGNPGLSALEAAAHPADTKYLYYLTGKDGLMHYALTYKEQLANERRYLAN